MYPGSSTDTSVCDLRFQFRAGSNQFTFAVSCAFLEKDASESFVFAGEQEKLPLLPWP